MGVGCNTLRVVVLVLHARAGVAATEMAGESEQLLASRDVREPLAGGGQRRADGWVTWCGSRREGVREETGLRE